MNLEGFHARMPSFKLGWNRSGSFWEDASKSCRRMDEACWMQGHTISSLGFIAVWAKNKTKFFRINCFCQNLENLSSNQHLIPLDFISAWNIFWMILIYTIWVENNGFLCSFVLKDIPDFESLVPGATGQQGLTRTKTQTADGALMTCQNLKENMQI